MLKLLRAGIVTAFVGMIASGAANATPVNLISNGGFEAGNFSSWSAPVVGGGSCNQPFVVGSNGGASGCVGFAPYGNFVNPNSGGFAAYASFDGGGPITKTLTQTFAVPNSVTFAMLSFVDAFGFGSGWIFPQSRIYSVEILNGSGASVATILSQSFTNQSGGIFQNWTSHMIDITASLLPLAGQNASLRFSLFIPQSFTGPGVYALDNVSLMADTAAVPTPGALALFGFGLIAFGAIRRRKAA
jgi:hypothetical protein